ncbi:MAG TPA: tryptophan--tRNA ligase [Blastocatellia bacterium]|nr:tryptophan--tRNA ligase [Blastocatellia bacterium]
MTKRLRILSGVQPSGTLHIGNYFGAIRQHIALQDEGDAFYFLANYHALTTINDAAEMRRYTMDAVLDYLALGLDPQKAAFFLQSDVPEVCELTWMLASVTGMGLLERSVSYKDKIARGIQPRAGLFMYPVLMAADILIYDSDVVPVGADQVQHIEMTRDMAGFFNAIYGEVFKLPVARVEEATAKVPGTDGQKMSKSYGNTIGIFDEGKTLKTKVMGIVTDSTPVEAPKDPDTNTIYQLFTLVATEPEAADMAERFRAGGYGYGDAKKRLLEAIDATFRPFREKRKELAAHPDYLQQVLRDGATRARAEAQVVMDRARTACGIG